MKYVITLGCLAGALAMYVLGSDTGVTAFFVAGIGLEICAWKRVSK
ncbi:hypothetical protein [Collimonas pratensis]|uniref:Putative membrane protein n=1 Tax=Collimonas pratensis TaxID=279113 RepID=A0A127Q9S9_9BURK|nr:hypothetical protein [Collimonas pratensis]AMP06807.1 putative membrane protein [Collimonas pratensis]